jgi:hypothetical protein
VSVADRAQKTGNIMPNNLAMPNLFYMERGRNIGTAAGSRRKSAVTRDFTRELAYLPQLIP